MFVLVVGAGRVGSALCRAMLRDGHDVSCLDKDAESQMRLEVGLERSWEDNGGQFTIGTALEEDALIAAGIEHADAFIAATNGDNTNIVIAQIAKKRFEVPTVIARVLDPYRAEWYERQGLRTICPTRSAIDMLEAEVRKAAGQAAGRGTAEHSVLVDEPSASDIGPDPEPDLPSVDDRGEGADGSGEDDAGEVERG